MKHTVQAHHFESGARGLIIDVPGSSVINLEIRFNSGFSFTEPQRYEVPHVLEHLMSTVTKKYSKPNQFIVEASKNGAYVNASTSVRANGYVYEFAPFELDRILDLVEEQLARPYLVADRLEAEIGNVREELTRNTTQPGTVAAMVLLAATIPGQWLDYPDRIRQLPDITLEDIQAYYRSYYVAANGFFSVAGPLGAVQSRLVERLEQIFATLPAGTPREWRADRAQMLDRPVVRHQPIGQIYYRLMRSLPQFSLNERRALAVLRTVLVGGMGSRIVGQAREHGWAYHVTGLASGEPGASNFGFGGYVTVDHIGKLFQLIGTEVTAVAEGSFTETELAAAVQLMTGSWLRSLQTPSDVMSWYSDEFDEWGHVRPFDDEVAALQHITPQQVTVMAQRVLAEGQFAMSLVGEVTHEEALEYQKQLNRFASH